MNEQLTFEKKRKEFYGEDTIRLDDEEFLEILDDEIIKGDENE